MENQDTLYKEYFRCIDCGYYYNTFIKYSFDYLLNNLFYDVGYCAKYFLTTKLTNRFIDVKLIKSILSDYTCNDVAGLIYKYI